MSTVYFLGAGASKADGFPLTSEFPRLVAGRIHRRDAHDDLLRFYQHVYQLDRTSLRIGSRRRQPKGARILPDVTEVLTVMDLALGSDLTFGESNSRDVDAAAIEAARRNLISSLGAVVQAEGLAKKRHNAYRLTRRMRIGDALITTNWDHALDRALEYRNGHAKPRINKRGSNVDYGNPHAILVGYSGQPLGGRLTHAYKLLKLHGGLNWYECGHCARLYINVDYLRALPVRPTRSSYNCCDCGALLRNLIVTPSFIKNYRSPHLAAVWLNALRTLADAHQWVFIGYSLPADDYHIRSLLLRARSVWQTRPRRRASGPQIAVVTQENPEEKDKTEQLFARYRALLGPSIREHRKGFKAFLLESRLRRRRPS